MKAIQDSVTAYLQACTGIRTVADRTRARGEYPLLAVSVREDGTVLVDGGRQAEHTYRVTVSAASDRERDGNTALLSSLTPVLLRGVPMGERTLHPLELKTEGAFANGLEFIERNHGEDNWFLQIETFDPHEPFYTLPKDKELYPHHFEGDAAMEADWPPYAPTVESENTIEHVRYNYAALVSKCDRYLGKVLDVMDKYNLWEDTMLIVNTDHGFLLGEHGWWGKTSMPIYNEIAHTPLFIYDPRRADLAGEKRNSIVQTIDLAPTLLEYFGMEIPKDMEGKPLKQVMDDDTPIREYAVFGYHGSQVDVTDGRYVYMHEKERKAIAGVTKLARERAKKANLHNRKLRDCRIHLNDPKGKGLEEDSCIFITEGDSASGSITKSRDVNTQAVFSLRGKPLNSFGLTKKVVYENEEFNLLQAALNIEDGLDGLRYNKVIVATDADVDGMHIRLLLITFFLQFFPDLIKKGHVYILQTPLFRVRNKKKTIYCYSEEERVNAINELSPNPEITRFKGLGEISPDEFKHFIGKDMRLEQVSLRKTDAVKELLEFYMGKNTMERQNFIIDNLVIEEDLAS